VGKRILVIIALLISGSPSLESAAAQTIKLHKKTTAQGEIDRTPYVTYAAFKAATVGGKTSSDKSSGKEVILGDLIAVSSLDEVTRVFGQPETFTHESPFGQDVLAFLSYEGFRLEYIKHNKDDPKSKYELRELELTSPDWHFTVNGAQLRPGMSIDQLSPAVRQTLDRDFSKSIDAFGSIAVAKPGTAKQAKRGGELQMMKGDAAIQIWVNGGIVDKIRFHRLLW